MTDVNKESGMTTVTARVGKGEGASDPISIEIDLGKNLGDASKKFGEDVVFSHFHASAVIGAQSKMRGAMAEDHEADKKPSKAKVTKALDGHKPGMKAPGASRLEKAQKLIPAMSAEERSALIKQLQEQDKAA